MKNTIDTWNGSEVALMLNDLIWTQSTCRSAKSNPDRQYGLRRTVTYQQAANAIAGLRDLACQVFIKAAQHCELRSLVGGQFHGSQGARHTAGRLGDDVRVPRRSWLRRRAKIGGEPVETAYPRARTTHRGVRNCYKRSTDEITLDQRH